MDPRKTYNENEGGKEASQFFVQKCADFVVVAILLFWLFDQISFAEFATNSKFA